MNLKSLQENVNETIYAFDDIADFIEEKTGNSTVRENIRPVHYGDILRRIEFSGGNVSVAQIFVYIVSKEVPETPVGGYVNLITGQIEAPDGWLLKPPTETAEDEMVWASTALWNDGINQTGWSYPYSIKGVKGNVGEQGLQGEKGDPGIQGPQGEKGEKGDKGDPGPQGPAGTIGAIGPQGPQGPQGEQGPAGPAGPAGESGIISDAEKEALINQAQANINAAKASLQQDILDAKAALDAAIAVEKEARENGIGNLEDAQRELAEAAATYAIKTDVEGALLGLEAKYFTDGKLNTGTFNTQELYNISKAALGIDAEVGPNDLAADSIFAQYVVAVVGNYVKLKAENIEGSVISGKTIQSVIDEDHTLESGTVYETFDLNGVSQGVEIADSNSHGPSWQLRQDGNGYFANGSLQWLSDGSFKLGGEQGIVRTSDGTINLGSKVVFNSGESTEVEQVYKLNATSSSGYAAEEYVYIGEFDIDIYKGTEEGISYIGEYHVWLETAEYVNYSITGNIGSYKYMLITQETPEQGFDKEYFSDADICATYSSFRSGVNSAITIHYQSLETADTSDLRCEPITKNVTKSDLVNWWNRTTIDAGKITTGSIDANKIKVNNLSASDIKTGTFSADRIDVNDLSVNQLNTTGKGIIDKGTIEVKDDIITVYSSDVKDKPVVRITGHTIEPVSEAPTEFYVGSLEWKSIDYINGNHIPGDGWNINNIHVNEEYQISSFVVKDDANYKLSIDGTYPNFASFDFSFYREDSSYSNDGATDITIYAETYIMSKGEEIDNAQFETNFYEETDKISDCKMYPFRPDYSDWDDDDAFDSFTSYRAFFNNKKIELGKSYDIAPGNYDIILKVWIIGRSDNSVVKTTIRYTHNGIIKITPSSEYTDMSRCDISSYGFRYYVDPYKYVEFTKNGDFKIKHGKSQFYLTNDKIFMGFNGADAKEVIPNTKKFRVYKGNNGATGRWMTATVLTLGSETYSDESSDPS